MRGETERLSSPELPLGALDAKGGVGEEGGAAKNGKHYFI